MHCLSFELSKKALAGDLLVEGEVNPRCIYHEVTVVCIESSSDAAGPGSKEVLNISFTRWGFLQCVYYRASADKKQATCWEKYQ